MSDHPVSRQLEGLLRRHARELGRCVKACLVGEDGKPTLEGATVLADLRKFAKLRSHKDTAFLRDLTGRTDPLAMARIEGRREVVNRLLDFMELDPDAARALVEVDSGN
jgi:hypothetical protein